MRLILPNSRWLLCLVAASAISACELSNSDTSNHQAEQETLATTAMPNYPLMDWNTLMPSDWDAMALLKDLDLDSLEDDDPRAFDLLKNMREQWNNAPVINHLDGKNVTINGYMVPLDGDADFTKTFLLVPYFGACIHTPPPPSNQVIYVQVPGKGLPLTDWESFFAVSGTLKVTQTTSALAVAGYHMQADMIKPTAEIPL
jgi:hypothetical protein